MRKEYIGRAVRSIVVLVLVFAWTGFFQSIPSWAQEARRDVVASQGVVAAAHPLAAQAGLEILKKGGNAFDAALATAFTLNVVEPNANGLGGGGFMIVYNAKDKKTTVIDFREKAPAKAAPDFYKLDEKGNAAGGATVTGYNAVAVPGQLRGMEMLHKKYASMKWADLMKPAIQYAEEGVPVSKTLNGLIKGELDRVQNFPGKAFYEKTYMKDGLPLEVGQKFVNKDLAASLRKIAKGGADVFYKGEIAAAIEKEFTKANGWITKKDLASYQAVLREPVQGHYRCYTILSVPPPSSGGVIIIEILNLLEGFDLAKMGPNSASFLQNAIQAQRMAFADRSKYLGDPDFIKVPVKGLASKKYAEPLRAKITDGKDPGPVEAGDPSKYETESTTSFSVIDKKGNMITVTQSLNFWWGSGVVPEGTGIFLNNHMDDFVPKPGSPNSVQPGKRPLSSMAPTLVLKEGKAFLALGSPGGPRIITAVSRIIMNAIDFKMSMQEAIESPRFHNQNAAQTNIESRYPEEARKELEGKGYQFTVKGPMDLYFGGAQGIMVSPGDGKLHGGGDPRRDGVAVGY
jgi:gamma-glutamyltranspeptidase / glutathione hydrolase